MATRSYLSGTNCAARFSIYAVITRAALRVSPLLLLVFATGCTPAAVPAPTPAYATAATPEGLDVTGTLRALRDDIDAIEEETGTELGISLYNGHINGYTGTVATLPSWSTIKVPIALAAQEHCDVSDEALHTLIKAAIEWSDNDSASTLLDCVGTEHVEEEVAEAGASINANAAFGRSEWPLASAARYGWYLSTRDEDNEVIVAMYNVVDEQQWGLGAFDNAAFKGGWSGDRRDGSWHSRQFGFVPVDDTALGVAIAARSPDGSDTDTIEALDQLTAALAKQLGVEIHPR